MQGYVTKQPCAKLQPAACHCYVTASLLCTFRVHMSTFLFLNIYHEWGWHLDSTKSWLSLWGAETTLLTIISVWLMYFSSLLHTTFIEKGSNCFKSKANPLWLRINRLTLWQFSCVCYVSKITAVLHFCATCVGAALHCVLSSLLHMEKLVFGPLLQHRSSQKVPLSLFRNRGQEIMLMF